MLKAASDSARLAAWITRCLQAGKPAFLAGLGEFRWLDGRLHFAPDLRPRVFIAYASEEAGAAVQLCEQLKKAGFDPWLDTERLLPGQNWPAAIAQAIHVSDYFVACLSARSLRKRGQFQKELRLALECARQAPLEDVYFLPVRLDDCRPPRDIAAQYQWVDLFPDFEKGVRRVVAIIRQQQERRSALGRRDG